MNKDISFNPHIDNFVLLRKEYKVFLFYGVVNMLTVTDSKRNDFLCFVEAIFI